MGGRALLIGSLSVAGVLALVAREASAQEEAEPLAVDYVAPEGCPAATSFFTDISSRTRRARAAKPGERARVLHVRIVRRGEGHVGTLAIEDTSGTGTAREVSGGACAEVASALALVAALAVDPRASTAPRPAATAVPTPIPEASATNATAASATNATAASATNATPAPEASTSAPAPDRAREPPAPRRPDGAPRRTRFGVGAAGEVAMIADAVVSLRIFGDLDFQRDGDVLAPSFRLALARSLDRDKSAAIGGATLRWTQAALDACPLRLAIGSRAALRPCLATAAGILEAHPADIGAPRSRTRPWVTLGAHARAVWAPIDRLAIEAEAGVIAPLYRESFFFEPNVPVYEAPAVAFVGRFGASLRFP